MGRDTVQLETAVTTISQEYLLEFTSEYGISEALHPKLPGPEDRIVDFPEGKIHLSQLSVIGAAKVSHFEINCRVLNIVPTLSLFRVFYTPSFNSGWMSFSKRPGKNTPQCYTKPLDSLKNWNNRFFWVDERVFSTIVDWRTSAPKDGMPAENTYSPEAVMILNTHCTPIQKQPEALLCLVGLSRKYYLGDEVYPTFLHDDDRDMNLFCLIRAPNPTKVKTGSRPRAAHGVPLLIVTANRVTEMKDPAAATDSSGEAAASEVPPSENATTTGVAPEAGQAKEVAATESIREGKSLAAIELEMGSTRPVPASQGAPVDVSYPNPLSFVDPQSRPSTDVTQSSKGAATTGDPESENTSFTSMVGLPESIYRPEWGITNGCLFNAPEAYQDLLRLRFEREAKLLKKSVAQVARRDKRIQARENEIKNLETLLEVETDMKKAAENRTIAGRRWVIGNGLRLAVMKCGESTELRKAFADVVSAGIAKGMSEGLKHGVEHGKANLSLEAIEAYDSEAEAKYITTLHALKDLKYPIVDQLESLKDAPMDVIMASLHLESDTGDDAPQWIRELHPSSSQLTIPVYPEARDPTDP
nr:transposase (putative), gypsy type [Tanacetum cinerariifolium]